MAGSSGGKLIGIYSLLFEAFDGRIGIAGMII